MLSVGIDVGTSTTQLVFSQLTIQNVASAYSVPRISIVDKQIVHRSAIVETPLRSPHEIDAPALRSLVEAAYQTANIRPEAVHTGAVIITGETARAENAQEILQALSAYAGDFVVATAGPQLEAVLAARGAGIDTYARHHPGVIANVDIGGGTTNIALYQDGELLGATCLDIGGRVIRTDGHLITAITPPIQQLANHYGLAMHVGDPVDMPRLVSMMDALARHLAMALRLTPADGAHAALYTNAGSPLPLDLVVDTVNFTGGVADLIADPLIADPLAGDPFRYGDVGVLLGNAIARHPILNQVQRIRGGETIGATVVGAGIHTTELSGSTIAFAPERLPIHNAPIVSVPRQVEGDPDQLATAIHQAIVRMHPEDPTQTVAVSLSGWQIQRFEDVQSTARALIDGAASVLNGPNPLIIVLEHDRAKAVGHAMAVQRGQRDDVICIDSVQTGGGDFIDIGTPVGAGRAVPVVVKTLVFNDRHGGEG